MSGASWAWRPSRRRRIRWWLRIGTLLAVIGVRRLLRSARARWEPLLLAVGAALMAIGFEVPSAAVTFLVGMIVMVVALVKGIAVKGRAAGQAADCWQWHG
jgi:hypothetical protein